ncbi:HAMP domain-containing sensor histidine kinase [Kitasatospora sp. MBT63]|uniref:sensor histidine kinase n=1 Tax=Kitasatospora sp. MBT63 TaxID=1444768 RepID=UPI00068DB6FB|nr:HAMP domain-containing sensor histidine kinase [Kitasatospora sp. MBT63]
MRRRTPKGGAPAADGRLGLRGRIAVGVLLALLLSSVALSALSYGAERARIESDFRARMLSGALSDLTSAANTVRTGDGPNAVVLTFQALAVRKFNTFTVFALTPEGTVAPDDPSGPSEPPEVWPGPRPTLITDASTAQITATPVADFLTADLRHQALSERDLVVRRLPGTDWLAVGAVVGQQGPDDHYPGQPVLAVEYHSLAAVDQQAALYLRGLLLVTGMTVLVGVVFAWLVAGRVQRPVRAAGAAARAFGDGDFSVRLPVRGRDELASLSREFNGMADRLAEAVGQLTAHEARHRRFVADVSHELRTPTASLLAAATALENPGTRDEAVRLVAPQLRRLSVLTEDLLEISRMDAGEAHLDRRPVDLAYLAADVLAHCADPDAVTLERSGESVVAVDARRLHGVLSNLVGNALRHGAAPVRVTVDGTAAAVTIRVADAGPGVPAELRGRIFDRFVRGDTARSGGPGHGLGLSIARENARLHGADLELAAGDTAGLATGGPGEPEAGGAVFVLRVPKVPADTE